MPQRYIFTYTHFHKDLYCYRHGERIRLYDIAWRWKRQTNPANFMACNVLLAKNINSCKPGPNSFFFLLPLFYFFSVCSLTRVHHHAPGKNWNKTIISYSVHVKIFLCPDILTLYNTQQKHKREWMNDRVSEHNLCDRLSHM